MASYPNRDALRKAHDIYLNAMYPFITKNALDVIEGEIDIADIAHIIAKDWSDFFKQRFEDIDPYYDARSAARQVVESRNRASHPPWDLDPEFTRTHLFVIANLLEKINRPDAKREVENIRDELFPDETDEHIANVSGQLAAARAEKTELEKQLKKRLTTMSIQLKMSVAGKTTAEERLSDVSNRLEEAEARKTELEKRLETTSDRLEKVKAELADCKERLAQLEPDSITFQGMTFMLHSDRYYAEGDDITQSFWQYWHSQGLEGKEEMRNAGWSVEKINAVWEVMISPEDFEAWITEDSDSEPKPTVAEKLHAANTLEDRKEIGRQVAELRINSAGLKGMAWKRIREKLGLKNDEFHKVIRLEDHFQESVVERIESFEDGWEYGGKLEVLLGFKPVGELANRIEACKPKPAPKEEAKRSPKSQRKWRQHGAVAALRDPTEIQEAEAKIAKILNPSEKSRLERELREAKRAVDGS